MNQKRKKIQKNSSVVIFLLILIFSSITIVPSSAQNGYYTPEEVFTEEFENTVLTKMGLAKVPSISLGIIHEGEIVYLNALGEQTHLNTSYHLASIEKTLCATAILQLYENGTIDLHDSINDYLPYPIENWRSPTENITFYHLLTHTTGIEMNDTYWNVMEYYNFTFPDYIYEFLHVSGSLYSPDYFVDIVGNSSSYQNINYNLLAYLVETISSKTYENYLNEYIFNPFGANNSRFDYTNYPEDLLAKVYLLDEYENLYEEPNYTSIGQGAGGLISAAIDMTYFLGAHMYGGEFNGVRILNATSIDLMHSPQTSVNEGFAWALDLPGYVASTVLDGSIGTGYGVRNYMVFSPTEDIGVVLLMNMFDFRYYSQNKDVFIYIFEEAMKLNIIKTSTTTSTVPELENIGLLFIPLIILFVGVITIVIQKRMYRN